MTCMAVFLTKHRAHLQSNSRMPVRWKIMWESARFRPGLRAKIGVLAPMAAHPRMRRLARTCTKNGMAHASALARAREGKPCTCMLTTYSPDSRSTNGHPRGGRREAIPLRDSTKGSHPKRRCIGYAVGNRMALCSAKPTRASSLTSGNHRNIRWTFSPTMGSSIPIFPRSNLVRPGGFSENSLQTPQPIAILCLSIPRSLSSMMIPRSPSRSPRLSRRWGPRRRFLPRQTPI